MTESAAERLHAFCTDSRTADRVMADMGRMLELQGATAAALRGEPLEWLAAQTRCAACGAAERCHRYLEGGQDDPAEFCPNTAEFTALRAAG